MRPMRTKLRGLVAGLAGAVTVVAVGVAVQTATSPAQAAAADPYTLKNVQIDGGGFVPGIIFNQTQQNLIYARTDIGGAYRWDQASQPLDRRCSTGSAGTTGATTAWSASPPTRCDPNKVYVAVGMYTNSWDPNNGAILRSSDKGATWQTTAAAVQARRQHARPRHGGAARRRPQQEQRSCTSAPRAATACGAAPTPASPGRKVTNFPNAGNYVQDPNDANGYHSRQPGRHLGHVRQAHRHRRQHHPDHLRRRGGQGEHRSTAPPTAAPPGSAIAGQPTGYLAHKGVLDTVGGYLYITTSDTGGPYDGGKGDVWKYATATGAWTQISPIPSSSADDYFGYSGLTIDRQHPNTIMVATQISWWPDAIFFRSTDGGATWTRIWDFTSYPNRSFALHDGHQLGRRG